LCDLHEGSILADILLWAEPTGEEQLYPAQRRRHAPTGRLHKCAVFVHHTIWISKQSDGPSHVQVSAEEFGKPLSGIQRDVVQCVQFEDDDRLDQLTDPEGAAGALVILRVIGLIDEIPTE